MDLNREKYDLWDDFCLKSDEAWFWHTTKWLDYCVCYGEKKLDTQNLSFMVSDNSGILAVCPLLLEKREQAGGDFHYGFASAGSGGFGVVPAMRNDLNEDRREKIYRLIYERIDALAGEHRAAFAAFRMTPLAVSYSPYNWLMKYGFLDSSINTQIVDLSSPLERTWSAFRKGHKYDTNRGEKYYDIHIYDKSNADKEIFDQYRLLHHKAAGRVTRPIETFEMMYHWIISEGGMLCGVSKDDRFAGFSYILLYKKGACYASASDDPDFETRTPIAHVIQWHTMKWLKEKGYTTYKLGEQQFGPQLYDHPSPKDMSISFFKRGFGGNTVLQYRGIKYFNKAFMKKDLNTNLNRLLVNY
jgi:hypothetical protein